MNYGKSDAQSAQRSAFSRVMAARRASGGPPHGSTAPAAGGAQLPSRGSPGLRLPTIASNSGAAATPSHRLSSSSYLNESARGGRTAARPAEASSLTSSPSLSSTPSYVITEKTPRAELLAIIAQLQTDLSQRTDSVNAIQRNFQRLSAMHHAEQEELQRLRALHSQSQHAVHTVGVDRANAMDRQVEELRAELEHQRETCASLQGRVDSLDGQCRCLVGLAELQATCTASCQRLVGAEWEQRGVLIDAARADRALLSRREGLLQEQRLLQEQVSTLLHRHTSRLAELTGEMQSRDGATSLSLTPGKEEKETGVPEFLAGVSAQLEALALSVETHLAALQERAEHRHYAELDSLQQRLAESEGRADDAQQALVRACLAAEASVRQAIEDSEVGTRGALMDVTHEAQQQLSRLAQQTAAQQKSVEASNALLTARVEGLLAAAERRVAATVQEVAEWRRTVEVEVTATHALLRQHGASASELAAAQAEWHALRETEGKAHRAELARVRQDAAGKLATAEARLKAAQQQGTTLQQQLDTLLEERQAVEVRQAALLEQRVREAAAERETTLSRHWFRVQSAMEESGAQTVQLLWDVVAARGQCSDAEAAAREALHRTHLVTRARMFSERDRTASQSAAAAAQWRRAAEHLEGSEGDRRRELQSTEAAQRTALEGSELRSLQALTHAADVSTLQQRLHAAQQTMHVAEAAHHTALDALKAQLCHAEDDRRAAAERATDAVAAAQLARQTAQHRADELSAFRAATAAAAQRMEAAESATESACCCPLCLQLLVGPVACVPCGHVYCAACLLGHSRNKGLSTLSVNECAAPGRRGSGPGLGGRAEVETARWVSAKTDPHSRLYCPECAVAAVSTVVELRSLGELTAKYSYKKTALTELLRDLK